jgi:hypothetical protein
MLLDVMLDRLPLLAKCGKGTLKKKYFLVKF